VPHFNFSCPDCLNQFSDLVPAGEVGTPCPKCSGWAQKAFTPTKNLRLALWCTREADELNARNNAFMQTDDFKNKLKSGEIAPYDAQNEYSSPEYSSSFEERAKYDGITFDGSV
jgi:hypothetical protein